MLCADNYLHLHHTRRVYEDTAENSLLRFKAERHIYIFKRKNTVLCHIYSPFKSNYSPTYKTLRLCDSALKTKICQKLLI